MNDYDGRPHWGKMHFQSADDAGAALPALGRLPGGAAPPRPRAAASPTPTSTASSARSALTG